ncbi:MAG: alpha/beta hydrolase [Burkholderiaceae bacterium]
MSLIDKVKDAIGADPTSDADPDMRRVLDVLQDLDGKPIETCTPEEARLQPTPADAVARIMEEDGLTVPPGVETEDIQITLPHGAVAGRIYRPSGAVGVGPQPVILYFHGGGWVIADLDTYDATPRSMALQTGAVVISAHYRQAPEHKFPAAHDDANATYEWLLTNASVLGVDAERVAIMGESAGGNMALNVSRHAARSGLGLPRYQVLVYPLAANDLHSSSYHQNSNARPLSRPMMRWFIEQVTTSPDDVNDPRLNLVASDLAGLPPTLVITAGIDPLRSDGSALVLALQRAAVPVEHHDYAGVTHEFFGMSAVVSAARQAQAAAAVNLKSALA